MKKLNNTSDNYPAESAGIFFTLANHILELPLQPSSKDIVLRYFDEGWNGSQLVGMTEYYPGVLSPHDASKVFIHILLSTTSTKKGFKEFTSGEYARKSDLTKSFMANQIDIAVSAMSVHPSLTHPSSLTEFAAANRETTRDIIAHNDMGVTKEWMFHNAHTIYDKVYGELTKLRTMGSCEDVLIEYMRLVRNKKAGLSQLYNMWGVLHTLTCSFEVLSTFNMILKATRKGDAYAAIPYKVYKEMFKASRTAIIGSEYLILGPDKE